MSHPLDSAYLKLRRATEHLEQIDTDSQLFLDAHPYVPVPRYNLKTGKHTVEVRVLADPPMHLGLLAGDMLHNARAALDHMVYQLADLNPKTPRGERTQYPIFDTPKQFDAMPKSYLMGVSDWNRAIIRTAQPYNPRYAMLGPMARLDDRDKHRIVEPIAASALGMRLTATPHDAIWEVRGVQGVVYFDDGAVLAHFSSDGEVDMQIEWTYYIRFGLRGQVGIDANGMRILLARVAELLGNFRGAFD